jgi:Dolichyl-phosphate-mannose-protein mannosyltransferase
MNDAIERIGQDIAIDRNLLVRPEDTLKPASSRAAVAPTDVSSASGLGIYLCVLSVVLFVGIFLRLPPALFAPAGRLHFAAVVHANPLWTRMEIVGVDENLYREYVNELSEKGLTQYPSIVLHYIEKQVKQPAMILPPVRFLYILTGYIWHSLSHAEALDSLKNVASLFSMMTLIASAVFAWRLRGPTWSLGVASLMAFAPTQIHMSQHALVDGFFTFWALLTLWMLWENLQAPRDWRWLCGYSASLAFLVLTKENSFFFGLAILCLLIANRWLQFGTVTRELVLATMIGPLLGVVALVFLAGGIDVLFGTYRLMISRNIRLPYAIRTGDGPWHRYLVDLLLVSPVIFVLAIGAIFRLERTKKPELFMSIFIAASYLVMCNVKYGMNLRYANMWDMPLRTLAVSALLTLLTPVARYRNVLFAAAIVLISAAEFRQYLILFAHYPLYELVSEGLLRALHILK